MKTPDATDIERVSTSPTYIRGLIRMAALKTPDATDIERVITSPTYIRGLIRMAGLTQRRAAELIGVNERTMRAWCSGRRDIPYSAQYCLEALAIIVREDEISSIEELAASVE